MVSMRASLWAGLGAMALLAQPALAADDGYQDVFSSVATAVGIMKSDPAPEIDYRERAPLVLPPRNDLPQPSTLARPASWPKDPDVVRRRRESEDALAPSEARLGNVHDSYTRQDGMRGRLAGAEPSGIPESAARAARCGNDGNNRACMPTQAELKAESEHYAESNPDTKRDSVEAGAEPDRVYLTQPPKGYLKTTKTVKVTTEAPKTYHDPSSPYANQLYTPKDDE